MLRKIWEIFVGCFRQVDLVLLALCTGTTLFGCLMIASATHYTGSYKNVVVQLAALCLGIVAYVLMSMLDLAEISKYWKWLLGGSLVLILLLKTPLGMESGGNRAWLGVEGIPVSLQPAEIVKITFILLLARQLVYLQENRDLKSVPSIAMLGGHLILIVGVYAAVSGDMGSALVFVFVFACMCFVAGSNSSMRTRPDTGSSELLMTCVLMLTSSPWRTKRGRFGRTIKGLLLMTSFVSRPYFRSWVLANSCSFQVVLLSGRVKFTNTSPSSFVCKVG